MKRFFERCYHFLQHIIRESKAHKGNRKEFGLHIANVIFFDGIIPARKTKRYLHEIEQYVDNSLKTFIENYKFEEAPKEKYPGFTKIPVWVCWWQGEKSMPELVQMCYKRLQQVLPPDKMELHLITEDNYKDFVSFPEHIVEKFNNKIITVTTLSDILRMTLLSKYGGVWIDATVFFTDDFPEEYTKHPFYSQKMANTPDAEGEACKSLWCGFCMAGYAGCPLFQFTRDAFAEWWRKYNKIVDYVLIDYLNLEGYNHFEEIRTLIDAVPNNNIGVFEMYRVLNKPYTDELYKQLTDNNSIHKLTYKMELKKVTDDGQETLYGHLLKEVLGNE